MRNKILGLAPLLAIAASAAFAAGPDDTAQNPRTREMATLCAAAKAGLVFNAACDATQKPVRVRVDAPERKRQRPPNAKRITRMPWQIGIFQ